MRKMLTLCAITWLALALVACDDESQNLTVDEAAVTAELQKHLETHLMGVASSASFVEDSEMMNSLGGEEGTEPTPSPDGGGGGEMEEGAREFVDMLKQHVFVSSNVESKTATSVTYRLSPEMCGTPDPEYPDDTQSCIDFLNEIPIRFVVSSPAESSYVIKVQIGTSKLNPVHFSVSEQKLGVEVDLAAAKATVEMLMNEMAEGEESPLPEVMQGRILVQLVRNGEGDFTATYGVLEPVHVKLEGMEFKFASAPEALVAHLVNATKKLELSSALGAIEITMPGEFLQGSEMICETSPNSGSCWEESTGPTGGTFKLVSAGAAGKVTFDAAAQEKLVFSDISLAGPITATVDGKTLFQLELAEAFSGSIEDLGETGTMSFEPKMAITIQLALQNLVSYLDDASELDAWMLDEELRIELAGSFETLLDTDLLKVVSGSFKLWAKSGIDVQAEAGMCVSSADVEENGHPFAGFSAVSCP
ncbi:MAG: hypothetical protein RBU37_25225 [Myxococcota bacterium]|jgi:hypothetical protein|nr:hypothetical protein [Myxococcota bacterium]